MYNLNKKIKKRKEKKGEACEVLFSLFFLPYFPHCCFFLFLTHCPFFQPPTTMVLMTTIYKIKYIIFIINSFYFSSLNLIFDWRYFLIFQTPSLLLDIVHHKLFFNKLPPCLDELAPVITTQENITTMLENSV